MLQVSPDLRRYGGEDPDARVLDARALVLRADSPWARGYGRGRWARGWHGGHYG